MDRLRHDVLQYRFVDKLLKAEFGDALAIEQFSIAGAKDYGHVRPNLPNLLCQVNPGHPRHGEVCYDQVELVRPGAENFQGLQAAGPGHNLVAYEAFKHRPSHFHQRFFVIDK